MISLPSAITKAVFDMIWDVFRSEKSGGTTRGERSRGVEDGIEMHHVNSDDYANKRTEDKDETSLIRRPKRIETETTPSQSDRSPSAPESVSPPQEILSLPAYLKEQFHETKMQPILDAFVTKFPTFSATIRRLPYALLPFAFSQFILVEALSYTGWINVFSKWLATVVGFSVPATIFVVGILSVILCNVSGTNIGATILLVKILKHPNFASRTDIPSKLETAAMLALAVGSNIGAVSFTFSASLAGIHPINESLW